MKKTEAVVARDVRLDILKLNINHTLTVSGWLMDIQNEPKDSKTLGVIKMYLPEFHACFGFRGPEAKGKREEADSLNICWASSLFL